MSNFFLAFTVVFPLFCMMALGYLLRATKVFNEDFLKQLNSLCFKVFLPIVLFYNVYKSHFGSAFSAELLGYALVTVIVLFIVLMIVVPLFVPENTRRGVIVQGIFRSNYVLFGLPITASLYGDEYTSITAVLIAFVIPIFNTLSVFTLACFNGSKMNFRTIALDIVKNPLIIASAIAFFFVLLDIHMPILLDDTVARLANIATPFAFIVLGGSFAFTKIKKNALALICSIGGKLIFVPAIFLSISILLGFRGVELVALLGMYASPTAISSYSMAQHVGADSELAGQIVVLGSILSLFTIFGWIVLLKHFYLI